MTEHEKSDSQTEQKIPVVQEGILRHQTHFSVEGNQTDSKDYDSGYEWLDCGRGHWKRVPKKAEK